jgi:outer membrane lipoprotein-sorting protein
MASRRLALSCALAAAAVLLASASAPAADLVDFIRKAESANRHVSYRGVKWTNLHVAGQVVRSNYKVLHQKPNNTRIDYYRPSELSGIITITKGGENWRFLPKKGEWERQKWELDADRVELTVKNYQLADGGSVRIAGRHAQVVKLIPKRRGSPSQTVWVDTEHFLILRSETRNAQGELKTASAFTEIRFNPPDIQSSAFVPGSTEPRKDQPAALGFQVVKPTYMVKGYQLVDVGSISIEGERAAHLKYTNGLNTISIFQRKGAIAPKEADRLLKTLPRGVRLETFTRGGITFTIIGDIAKSEMDKIVRSLQP